MLVTVFLTVLLCTLSAFAEQQSAAEESSDSAAVQGADAGEEGDSGLQPGDYLDNDPVYVDEDAGSSVIQELIGVDASQPLEVIILLTLIALAPSLLIMMTCFTRIIIVLGFLRSAMQTQNTPPNIVLTGMALCLTIFHKPPLIAERNEVASHPDVSQH